MSSNHVIVESFLAGHYRSQRGNTVSGVSFPMSVYVGPCESRNRSAPVLLLHTSQERRSIVLRTRPDWILNDRVRAMLLSIQNRELTAPRRVT